MTLPRTLQALESGIAQGLHKGAQIYVSLRGETLVDAALGEARVGQPMTTDTLMLWLSSTKPTTAVALAILWERGELTWDDPIVRFIPEFAQGGKEAVTLRHALTHTGGFRVLDTGFPRLPWDETIARLTASRLEPRWVPGEKAGYHMASSWFILGEVIRRIDGRTYDAFLRQEVFVPLGMNDCWVGMPPEQYHAYGPRIAAFYNTEHPDAPEHPWHREDHIVRPSPGGNGFGPIRELGRFYEALLAAFDGHRTILSPQTVEALVARHRTGLYDHTFRHVMDWGLGFIINSAHYHEPTLPYAYGPHASRRTFGHSGYRSSTAFADPEHRLVVAFATNGTPGEDLHRERMRQVTAAIYEEAGLAGAGGSEPPRGPST